MPKEANVRENENTIIIATALEVDTSYEASEVWTLCWQEITLRSLSSLQKHLRTMFAAGLVEIEAGKKDFKRMGNGKSTYRITGAGKELAS